MGEKSSKIQDIEPTAKEDLLYNILNSIDIFPSVLNQLILEYWRPLTCWNSNLLLHYQAQVLRGDSFASARLAYFYEFGYCGIKLDYQEAYRLYKFSAEHYNCEGYAGLSNLYLQGLYVNKDFKEGIRLAELAASYGSFRGQGILGWCYQNGKVGLDEDLTKAIQCYQIAANYGDIESQVNLGSCYQYGKGVTKDYTKALHLYNSATKQGAIEAQVKIGLLHFKGEGVKQDFTAAARCWKELSDKHGNASARAFLALCYQTGLGIEQNETEALRLLRLAAEQNSYMAQYGLAEYYQNGLCGLTSNKKEALKWFKRAADQGFTPAQERVQLLEAEDIPN